MCNDKSRDQCSGKYHSEMVDHERKEAANSEGCLWLEKEIVPKIAEVLGKDAKNLQCEIKVPSDGIFISTLYMVELIFCCEDGMEMERIKLVVKIPPKIKSICSFFRTDILFHNELIFYQRFGRNYVDYPKCVLLIPEPITSAVIVLENVTDFGFKSIQPKEDVDMKRALAAVREIGKFHARGYVLKEKNPEEFFSVANELCEIYDDSANPVMIKFVNVLSMRPINYLNSINYDPSFCKTMSTLLQNAHKEILQDCVKPRNELAVLCHGDFTSNNVLLKKEDHGEFKAMLIDFAHFRYASPAVDMATFLYLSCEEEVRKKFPVIFKAYHDTILEHLEDQGIRDLQKYSYDAFLKDYKRHAIIGCEIAIFFIPVMFLGYQMDLDKFMQSQTEDFERLLVSGGDVLSKRLADMLLELKNNGCLDHMMGNRLEP